MIKVGQRGCLLLFTAISVSTMICVLIVLLTISGGLGRKVSADEPLSPRIVYGLTFEPSGFDPHIYSSSELGIVFRSVYDTLLYRDPTTKQIVAGLAQSVDAAPDGLSYIFHLKPNIKFHDGELFDANAAAANLDRIISPETNSLKALPLLGSYSRYEIIDPLTIKLILNTPYAPFLDALCQPYLGMASPKAFKAVDTARYQFHQVGTGPFKMIEYVPGDHILLRRNADYAWGPDFYKLPATDGENATSAQLVQEIEFRFFTEPATRAPALESGQVQIVGELSPTDAATLSREGTIRLLPQPIPGQPLQFFMNTAVGPTQDLKVRQALVYATDRQAIVDSVFQQLSPVAYGPLSSVTPYYTSEMQTLYPYNPAQATTLLQEAGYTDSNNDGILEHSVSRDSQTVLENLKLVLIVPPWNLIPQVAQKLQSQWAQVGIETELRQVTGRSQLLAEVDKNDYSLVAFNDFGLDASILDPFYMSNGSLNFTHYASTDLDTYLTRALGASNESERAALYASIQQYIMQNALILPIRDHVNLNATMLTVENLTFDAYGWYPLLANLTVAK